MVRLLRKLRGHKSQPRHARYLDRKPRDKDRNPARENGGTDDPSQEKDNRSAADDLARVSVISTAIPSD